MSFDEVKAAAASLPVAERLWLAAYLHHLSRVDCEANARELGAINKRMDEGQFVTLDELKKMHEALEAEGL